MNKMLCICLCLLTAGSLMGQAGRLDSSFGGRGWVSTNFVAGNRFDETGRKVLPLPNGSLIVLLQVGNSAMITRFNADGSQDLRFGTGGYSEKVAITCEAAVLGLDGKIIVGGNSGLQDFALARYNSTGTLDSSFGDNGLLITVTGKVSDHLTALAQQPNGKIVAGGFTHNPATATNDFSLLCYEADGSLDQSFGRGGKLVKDFYQGDDKLNAMAIQANGKIIAAGQVQNTSGNSVIAIARFNSDGTTDSTFGHHGTVFMDFGTGYNMAYALAVQTDAKLVLAGKVRNTAIPDLTLFVARFNAEGTLDDTFGNRGTLITDISTIPSEMIVQADGKIVMTGPAAGVVTSGHDFAVVRITKEGALDPSFGTRGVVDTDILGHIDVAYSLAVLSGGKIVVAGKAFERNSDAFDFALVQYDINGAPDPYFSKGGKFRGYFPYSDRVSLGAIALQEGKVLVSGSVDGKLALARYNTFGTPDSTYSGDGMVRMESNAGGFTLALQQDGKSVVGGTSLIEDESKYSFALARIHADGTPDNSFGTNGRLTTSILGVSDRLSDIVIQKDGKIIAGGNVHDNNTLLDDFALVRYHPDGSLDPSFSNDSKFISEIREDLNELRAIALQQDGKLIVAGQSQDPENGRQGFALARFDIDGAYDLSFGKKGTVITHFENQSRATALALQQDGKIVLAGSFLEQQDTGNDLVLARYNVDGTLDASFGRNGRVETDLQGRGTVITAIAIQESGQIVISGITQNTKNMKSALLMRYTSGGLLDSSFGSNGKVVPEFQVRNLTANDIAIEGARVYLVCSQFEPYSKSFLAAYDLTEAGLVVASFTLIDAVRDTDAGELKDGAVVNLSAIRGTRISIRANTGGAAAGSVMMQLSGTQVHNRTENRAPYALFGNRNKEHTYRAWRPSPGPYTLTATPYAGTNGRGTKGTPYTVRFTIVEELSLARFTLINAARNTVISTLSDGAVIDLAHTPHINIRAEQGTGVAESIRFGVNDQAAYSMESSVPFALAGDNRGDYAEWQVSPGTYTITATPYSENYGRGTMGTALRITITIIDSKAEQRSGIVQGAAGQQQQEEGRGLSLEVLPNPVKESGWVQFRVPQSTTVALFLADGAGRRIQQVFGGRVQGGVLHRLKVQTQGLPPGLYFCRLVTAAGKTVTSKLVRQ